MKLVIQIAAGIILGTIIILASVDWYTNTNYYKAVKITEDVDKSLERISEEARKIDFSKFK